MSKLSTNFNYVFYVALIALLFIMTSFFMPQEWTLILDRAGIILGYIVSCLTAGFALVAFVNRYRLKRWFSGNSFFNRGESFDVPAETIHAMIIPVSPRSEQPEWILRWLKPKRVAFLYTVKSLPVVKELQKNYAGQIEFFLTDQDLANEKFCLQNPYDLQESHARARHYIRHFLSDDILPQNVFVDTTAGTVPMSVGIFQAAEEYKVSSIYIEGAHSGHIRDITNEVDGRPVFLSDHSNT